MEEKLQNALAALPSTIRGYGHVKQAAAARAGEERKRLVERINAPVEDITDRVKGKFDYGIPGKVVESSPHIMRYWNDHASYPFQSHELWFLTEDIRWGKFEATTDTKALIAKVNREDIWREAAKDMSVPASDIPASKSRGKETFFDGKVFDPENPAAYLKSLSIKRVEV